MRFRNPDDKKMNVLRLLPVFMLVVAVFFTGHQVYRYIAGYDETLAWVGIGAIAMIYFAVRTLHTVKRVFVWEHREGDGESDEDDQSPVEEGEVVRERPDQPE